ncbi:hypothetical protein M9434_006097 [Picochlorum sp. BPE23]|nr:hypothetical protein M9434_006097 [Picochlorum sp. BPE23]
MFRLEALRRVRECLLDRQVEYEDIMVSMREICMRRAVVEGVLDRNTRKTPQNRVWVPPSSSVGGSKHSRLVKRGSRESDMDDIRVAQAEYKRLGEEQRRLVLKRCFFIWRMSCILFREMQSMLDSLRDQDAKSIVRHAYDAWVDVSQPWIFYDGEVFQKMAQFRLMRDCRLRVRMLDAWRRWSHRRVKLRSREILLKEMRDRSLLKAAMNQWRVYRVVHHLDGMRAYLASTYRAMSLVKKSLAVWKSAMLRRLLLQGRMQQAAFSSVEGCRSTGPKQTVDDLLFGSGSTLMIMGNDALETRESIRSLKLAWNQMQPCLRWGDLTHVDFEEYQARMKYVPEQYIENSMWSNDDFMDRTYRLVKCDERLNMLEKEEQHVCDTLAHMTQSKIPALQQRHEKSFQRLIEYEKIISEMQEVRQQLEAQVHAAVSVEKKRWHEYENALDARSHLESLHASILTSLETSQADWECHRDSMSQVGKDIDVWTSKIREHARVASKKATRDSELTAAVKLKEAQSRLQQAQERQVEFQRSKDGVWNTYQDALIAEKEMSIELERERMACDQSKRSHEQARENLEMLQEELLSIDREYNELVPRLDLLSAEVDTTNEEIEKRLADVGALRASHEQLLAELKHMKATKTSLEIELKQCQAEKVSRMEYQNTRVGGGEVIIVQNSSLERAESPETASHSEIHRSIRSLGRSHGETVLLESARSYHILARARRCLSTWRLSTCKARSARMLAQEKYAARFLPVAFAAWKQAILSDKKFIEEHNARRIKSLFLQTWNTTASTCAKQAHIVSSQQQVLHRRLLQRSMFGWRDHVVNIQKASDFACRGKNKLKCKIFHFWRTKTAISADLNLRYLEFTEKKEAKLLTAVFAEWNKATHHRILLRNVIQRACNAWELKLKDEEYYSEPAVKSRCIAVWSLHTHQERETRRLEQACSGLSLARNMRTLAAVLAAWSQETQKKRKAREEAYTRVHESRIRNLKYQTFSLWHSRSTTVSLTLASLHSAWTYDHPLQHALQAWFESISKIRRRRKLESISKQLTTQPHNNRTIPASQYAWCSPIKNLHKDAVCHQESPNAISV